MPDLIGSARLKNLTGVHKYRGGNFQLVFPQDCDKPFTSNFIVSLHPSLPGGTSLIWVNDNHNTDLEQQIHLPPVHLDSGATLAWVTHWVD